MTKITPVSAQSHSYGSTPQSNQVHDGNRSERTRTDLPTGPAPFNPLSVQPLDVDKSPAITAEKAAQTIQQLTELAGPFGLPVDTPENRVRTAQKIHDHYEALFIQQIGAQVYGVDRPPVLNPTPLNPSEQYLKNQLAALHDAVVAVGKFVGRPLDQESIKNKKPDTEPSHFKLVKSLLLDEALKLPVDVMDKLMESPGLTPSAYETVKKINTEFAVRYYDTQVSSSQVGDTRTTTAKTWTRYINNPVEFESGEGSQTGLFERRRWQALLADNNPFSQLFWREVSGRKQQNILSQLIHLSETELIQQHAKSCALLNTVKRIHRQAASVLVADHIRGGRLNTQAELISTDCTPEFARRQIQSEFFFTRSGIVQSTRFGSTYPQFGYRSGNTDQSFRFCPFATSEGYTFGLVFGAGDLLLLGMAMHRIVDRANNFDVDENPPINQYMIADVVETLNNELRARWPDYIGTHSANISAVFWWRGPDTIPSGAVNPKPVLALYGYESSYRSYSIGESRLLASGPSKRSMAVSNQSLGLDYKHGSHDGAIGKTTYFGKRVLRVSSSLTEPSRSRWWVMTSPNIQIPIDKVSKILDENRYYPVDHLANALFQESKQNDGYVIVTRLRGTDAFVSKPGWFGTGHPIVLPTCLPPHNPIDQTFSELTYRAPEVGQPFGPHGTFFKIGDFMTQIRHPNHMMLPGSELARIMPGNLVALHLLPYAQVPLATGVDMSRLELNNQRLLPGLAFAGVGKVSIAGIHGETIERLASRFMPNNYFAIVTLKDDQPRLAKQVLWALPRTQWKSKQLRDRIAAFDAFSRFDTSPSTRFSVFLYHQVNPNMTACCRRVGIVDQYVSTGGYELFPIQSNSSPLIQNPSGLIQYFGRNPSGEYVPISDKDVSYSPKKGFGLKPGFYAVATTNLVSAAGGVLNLANQIRPKIEHISRGDTNVALAVLQQYSSVQDAGLLIFERSRHDLIEPEPTNIGPSNFFNYTEQDAWQRVRHLKTLDPFRISST